MKDTGDRLRYIIRMRGIKPAEMARDLNLGRGHISNIMTGRIQAPKKHLPAIAKYLQVSQSWLLTGEGHCNDSSFVVAPVYEMSPGQKKQICHCRVQGMSAGDQIYGVVSGSLPDDKILIISPAVTGDGLYLVEDEKQGLIIAYRNDRLTHLEWYYLSATPPENPSVTGKIEAMIDKETNIYEA